MKNKIILLGTAALVFACNKMNNSNYQALHLEYMDSTVNPANDFYMYVNGKWMKTAKIPEDRGRWGAFEALDKKADSQSLAVLEKAVKSNEFDSKSDEGKAVTLFKTVMDSAQRNAQGMAPLKPYLSKINAIKTSDDINNYLIEMATKDESSFFGISVESDAKNSNKNVVYVTPPALGLPDKEYYLKTDDKSATIQNEYMKLIADIFVSTGASPEKAISDASLVYEMEKSLAVQMLSKEQKRNPVLLYNPISFEQFSKNNSKIKFKEILNKLKINTDTIVVSEPKFISALPTSINNVESSKLLLSWSLIRSASRYLDDKTEKRFFEFYGKKLRGTPAMQPRKERALDEVNRSIGEALGKLYVKEYFSENSKNAAKQLVSDLIAAYTVRIKNLDWMSAGSKEKALKKLNKIMIKIGFPDKWRDYATMNIKGYNEGGNCFENILAAREFETLRNASKFGKPVDKSEWLMNPQTVNAYYNPQYNEIVFPAAILQAPFFDFRNDAAVNFGGIGAVIGHEISHGFDDEGAQYDENGNLVNWWTEEDLKQFKSRGALLAKQFNAFEALPGKFVNGEFTMGENIGDLGGVASAYDGLQIHLNRNKEENKKIDNLTPEQRFFFSWATIWRNKIRDEELTMRLATDPHSPGYFRAIGPLQNHDGFYKAFNVKPGDKMYKPDSERVKIW